MLLSDLSINQEVLIAGTIKKIRYSDGRHYDTLEVELDNHDTVGSKKTIELDPDNIGDDSADAAAVITLVQRWQAIGSHCNMNLEGLEAASFVIGEGGVVTITPIIIV